MPSVPIFKITSCRTNIQFVLIFIIDIIIIITKITFNTHLIHDILLSYYHLTDSLVNLIKRIKPIGSAAYQYYLFRYLNYNNFIKSSRKSTVTCNIFYQFK